MTYNLERILVLRFETGTFLQKIKLQDHEKAAFNYFLGFPTSPFKLNGPVISESIPLSKPENGQGVLTFGKFRIHQEHEDGESVPLQLLRNADDEESNISQLKKFALVVKIESGVSDEAEWLTKLKCKEEEVQKIKTYRNETVFLVKRDEVFESHIDTSHGTGWTAKIFPVWTIKPDVHHQLILDIKWDARFGKVHHRMMPLDCDILPIFQNVNVGIIDEVVINKTKFKSYKKIFLTTDEERFPSDVRSHFDDYGEIKKWTKREAGGLSWIEVHFKRPKDAELAIEDSSKGGGITFETGKVFCLEDFKTSRQSGLRKRVATSPLPELGPPARPRVDEEQTQLVERFRSVSTGEEPGSIGQEQPIAGPSRASPLRVNLRPTILIASQESDEEEEFAESGRRGADSSVPTTDDDA